MKTRRLTALTAVALTAALGMGACTAQEESAAPAGTATETVTVTESATPAETAGEYESADLLRRLIEEEKVAHDLYLAFDEMYGARVFGNITESEVSHQDRVLAVMEDKGVEDPRLAEPGQFADPGLQELYDDFLARGSADLPAAYQAGVDFEVMDIDGLEEELAQAPESDTDLTELLEYLIKGSKNHLEAFQRQVDR